MLELQNKLDCCGCRACEQACPRNCISILPDECGFLYPKIDPEVCINCGLCNKVCPFSHFESKLDVEQQVYAMAHHDNFVILSSSSGGVWSGICNWGINNGYSIYGVAFDNHQMPVYLKAVTLKECEAFRRSKYVQCNPELVYGAIKKDLENGDKVVFSGTPCFVKALRNFLRKDYEGLLTVDLICHGIPSPLVWRRYLDFLEKQYKGKIVSVNMRDKRLGWTHRSLTSVVLSDGREYCDTPATNTYMSGFGQELFYRPSCYECRFSNLDRPGDLTIGDFWEIEKYTRTFLGIKGVSCCITNSSKGKRIIDDIKDQFVLEERKLSEALQPNLKAPTKKNQKTEMFWKDWVAANGEFDKIARVYFDYGIMTRLKYALITYFPFIKGLRSRIKKIIR